MKDISFIFIGVLVGVFWGTLFAFEYNNWLMSLVYMVLLLITVIVIEIQEKKEDDRS